MLIRDLKTALACVDVDADEDEIECMVANFIYKVLSAAGPQ